MKEWKEEGLPKLKAKAQEEGRVIAYLDESAFSYCPYVCRTYSPKGKRPVLRHGYSRGGIQAISFVTENGGLYYKIKSGTLSGADIADFLRDLLHHFRKWKLLIIWDGAMQHKSQEVKAFLRTEAKGRIHLAMLPSHSPELNVSEQAHGYIKKNLLANRLFYKVKELKNEVSRSYEWLKKQPDLVYNFFFHKDAGFYLT